MKKMLLLFGAGGGGDAGGRVGDKWICYCPSLFLYISKSEFKVSFTMHKTYG